MERRPSATTAGIEAKSFVDEYDLGHVARGIGAGRHGDGAVGLLDASTASLTPSPVMATVFSRRLSACRLALLLRGHDQGHGSGPLRHRAWPAYRASWRPHSVRPGTPPRAIDDTVRGSSPLIALKGHALLR